MFTFHKATPDDAEQIAAIIMATSEGIVEHLLDNLLNGLSGASILAAAFIKGETPYDTDNVIRSRHGEQITSLLFSYPSSDHHIPSLMETLLPAKRLAAVRPILERSVPDSLYINSIWVAEHLRGKGHAQALMMEAASRCRALGMRQISLFCWNDNLRAMRFYARQGFYVVERLTHQQLPLSGHASGGSLLCMNLVEE